jgi:hypothetical protein
MRARIRSCGDELEKHLWPLRREGLIVGWSDQAICPGSDWRNEIEEHLNRAQIILLLVSV